MWALALLPPAALALLYGRLPDQVPLHWGLNGAVQYGGKALLWVTALLCPALAALLRLLPKIDPKRRNYARFQGVYDGFSLLLLLFLALLNAVTLAEGFHPGALPVYRVVTLALAVLFVHLGNQMPRVKSNFFLGIKTPWTLSDPDVWNRTHRLAGILFFCLGLLLIPAGLFFPEGLCFWTLLLGAIAAALLPILFSCLCYRQKKG